MRLSLRHHRATSPAQAGTTVGDSVRSILTIAVTVRCLDCAAIAAQAAGMLRLCPSKVSEVARVLAACPVPTGFLSQPAQGAALHGTQRTLTTVHTPLRRDTGTITAAVHTFSQGPHTRPRARAA